MLQAPTVFLFTGHLIDSLDRAEERFPYELLDSARSVLKAAVDSVILLQKPCFAISSLAAGGDMLFVQEMLDNKIPVKVFLPFEVEKFLLTSVTYEKRGDQNSMQWYYRFYEIIEQAKEIIITGTSRIPQKDAFLLCNKRMLAHALEWVGNDPKKVLTFALVKKNQEIKKGGALEFLRLIETQNVIIKTVWPD